MQMCSITNCKNRYTARGFCGTHYWQQRKLEEPELKHILSERALLSYRNKIKTPEYKQERLKKLREYTNKRRIKFRKMVLTHYSNGNLKCSCCGESNIYFLTIDHINNNGNKHRKEINSSGGPHFYDWLIKNNYPAGYDVLCMNCNHGKSRNNGKCPHKN